MTSNSAVSWTRRRGPLVLLSVGVFLVLAAIAVMVVSPKWGTPSAEFAQRQKISANSALHFSFPAFMDHASVEKALASDEGIEGTREWNNETLVLRPAAPLKAGKEYTFVLPASAEKADGEVLGRELTFVFTVAGPPVVAARLPNVNAVDINPESTITIVFDRAMIPLTQVQGEVTKETVGNWPVTIEPNIAGRWRWISTVARQFTPDNAFVAGTRYTVKVPKGIEAVAGDKTEQDFSWHFDTLRPIVETSTPVNGSRFAGPTTELSFTFNREIDLNTARSFISLFREGAVPVQQGTSSLSGASSSVGVPKGTKVAIKEVKYGTKEEDGKRVTDKRNVVVVPQQVLAFQASYALYAAPGIKGLEGALGTASGFAARFSTVGELKVESASYNELEGHLDIVFNNPINTGSLVTGVTISPLPNNSGSLFWNVSEWTDFRTAMLYPEFNPSTKYTLTVTKNVKDAFGQSLKEQKIVTFTTQPLRPQVMIHSKGQFGIFEKGKSPIYYLNSVNVSKLDVGFAPLSLPQFLQLSQQRVTSYDAASALPGIPGYQALELPPKGSKDKWGIVQFDVEKTMGPLAPGIYALTLSAPEATQQWLPGVKQVEEQYFAITNLSITLKYSGDDALVWVTDMRNGNPVPGARISFHSLNGSTPVTGTTDAKGFFQGPINIKDFATYPNNQYEPEFWVTAETADDLAFVSSQWTDGVRPWDFGMSSEFRSAQAGAYRIDAYVYTERPLYRPGDTVSFKGMLRLRDWDGKYSIPSDRRMDVSIKDAEGKEVYNKTLPINAFGSFNASFPLDKTTSLGAYWLEAKLTPETEIDWNNVGTMFSVLDYRKPEYEVKVEPVKEEVFAGEAVAANVTGTYYFGAPMDSADVTWRAHTENYYFNKYTDGWYSFSLQEGWCWTVCDATYEFIGEGKGKLDANGKLPISINVPMAEKELSQIVTIEADVTDPNNQVVSERASIILHKSDAYVGIKTTDYIVTPGTPASAELVTVKPDGSPYPNASVKVALFSRTWNSIKKKGVDGEYYYENEPKDTFLRDTSVTTDAQGKAKASVLVDKGGEHVLVATVRDAQGREAKASTSVYAYSSSYVNWPHTNSDRMDVVADKLEYNIGETVTILVKSPYQGKGVKALVTVEREGIMSKQVIDLTSNAQSIKIPVTAEMIPNAYVSVVVVKPRMGETFDDNGLDTGAPAFKIGYAKFGVNTFTKRLNVDIKTDKERYLPGETVKVTLKTTDALGKPIATDLSLGVVDMSVLALSSFRTPDLTSLFYRERGLGIYTSQTLKFLLERFKPGSKGGGGDKATRARGNFKDTAFWKPDIITNEQGEASVSFQLPDNLTTWQLLAIGSTKAHNFGSFAKTVIETKNVIVRPVRPRFAVMGDKITLGAIVHNFLPETKTFTVKLEGAGFTGTATKNVTLKTGEQTKVEFPVVTGTNSGMKMTFSAVTEGANDTIIESIPVYPFGSMQSVATNGVTEKTALEKVIAPSVNDAKEGSLSVVVAPSVAAYIPLGLEYLKNYPYGCAEQTLSGFLPSVAIADLQGFEQLQFVDQKKLDEQVTTGLQRIYTFQRPDGGFGYWQGSMESYPPLSAYVLYGLVLTKEAGYAVDQGVMTRTAEYLNGVLRVHNSRWTSDPVTRASMLHALAVYGQTDLALLNNLYDQRSKLPLFAKAQLAMAYSVNASSNRAVELLKEIGNTAKVDGRGTHFEEASSEGAFGFSMNTNERTTALVVKAMLQADPKNPLIPNIVRYLLSVRERGHWDTTQSTVESLLALNEYLTATKELNANYAAGIDINGKRVLDWTVKPADAVMRKEVEVTLNELKRSAENEVTIGKNGQGKLYYDMLLSYFLTADTLQPAEEGIGITRSLQPIKGTSKDVNVGETYLMSVIVTVPEERHFVAVEAPLPAGMELIDINLETTQKNLLSGLANSRETWGWDEWKSETWRFTHREYRDDQLFLFAEELPAGVYQYKALVRATTPGTFRFRPARVFEMYFPEIFGQTDGGWMTVKE